MATRRLDMEVNAAAPPTASVMFDGHTYQARPGETLAQTLLAHGVYVLGRSSKYHRPRGLFCGVGSCGQCVARVDGLPNVRLCLAPARQGTVASSQNTLGTARFDALASVDWVFYRGLDHHHLMTQAGLLNRVAVGMARQLAGLGRLPANTAERFGTGCSQHTQVAVVGAGPAGRAAAAVCRARGLQTRWLEAARAPTHGSEGAPEAEYEHRVVGFYDDRELLVLRPAGLLRLRADAVILALGTYELPPPCPGNDLPGVLSARAVEQALAQGILPARQVMIAAADDPYARRQAEVLARALRQAGATVIAQWVTEGFALSNITGCAPHLLVQTRQETIPCEALVWCGRGAPAYELPRQMGVDTPFNPRRGGFAPIHDGGVTAREGLFIAGELAGVSRDGAAAHGAQVGAAVAASMRLSDDGVLV